MEEKSQPTCFKCQGSSRNILNRNSNNLIVHKVCDEMEKPRYLYKNENTLDGERR